MLRRFQKRARHPGSVCQVLSHSSICPPSPSATDQSRCAFWAVADRRSRCAYRFVCSSIHLHTNLEACHLIVPACELVNWPAALPLGSTRHRLRRADAPTGIQSAFNIRYVSLLFQCGHKSWCGPGFGPCSSALQAYNRHCILTLTSALIVLLWSLTRIARRLLGVTGSAVVCHGASHTDVGPVDNTSCDKDRSASCPRSGLHRRRRLY